MRFVFLICLMVFNLACASINYNGRIENVAKATEITELELVGILEKSALVVVGEKHYTKSVQNKEAELLDLYYTNRSTKGTMAWAWEFLAWTKQSETNSFFQDFKNGKITAEDFFKKTSGAAEPYLPLLESANRNNLSLVGLNLARSEKAPITKGGLSAADQSLIPQGYQQVTGHYRDRFEEVMKHHVPAHLMANYYEAQCVTDDVMAVQLINALKNNSSIFAVMGSFHMDYFTGTIQRLSARDSQLDFLSLRIVDASDYTESELKELVHHPVYGPISDIVIYVNEPK